MDKSTKYSVSHYHQNPRHNETVPCDTLAQARRELSKITADETPTGSSILYAGQEMMARRSWDKRRASWYRKHSAGK